LQLNLNFSLFLSRFLNDHSLPITFAPLNYL
jgi:hypothetical protein